MAFSVTMYSTTFDRYNRAMNKLSLETYLSALDSTKYTVYDTGYQIMPNTPFIVKVSALTITPISAYNYISAYWLDDNGEQHIYYVGFIDSVDFLANGTARINHTMDYWCNIFYMDNVSFIDGTVTRAHSNDRVNNLYNPFSSYNAPEEQYNTDALTFGTYKPRYGINTLSSFNNSQYWLYVYIANPWSIFEDTASNRRVLQQYVLGNDNDYSGSPCMGVTACYPCLIGSYNQVKILLYNGGEYVNETNLFTFTNDNITSMLISTIPPTTGLTLDTETAYNVYSPTEMINVTMLDTVEGLGFDVLPIVQYMKMIPISMQDCVGLANSMNSDLSVGNNKLTLEEGYGFIRSIYPVDDAYYTADNLYLTNDVLKAWSLTYNPMYIENTALTAQTLPFSHTTNSGGTYSTGFYVGFTGDLTTYVYSIIPIDKIEPSFAGSIADSTCYTKNIVSTFSPTVIKDYWTRLNASIESMKAEQAQSRAIVNGISSAISTVFAPLSGFTGMFNSSAKMNDVGVVSGGLSAIGSTAVSGTNTVGTIIDSVYNYKTAGANKEIAQYQYQKGITNDTGAMYLSGAFLMNDLPTIYTVCNYDNYYKFKLHKKGVTTNIPCNATGTTGAFGILSAYNYFTGSGSTLDITSIFKRTHFNYVEAESVSLSNVNSAYNANISNMFAQGVTLWRCDTADDVDNVGNYSILNVVG